MHLKPDEAKPAKAFTLIELLVVVAVLVMLAAMMTAIAGDRPNTRSWQCINNLRQLTAVWTMSAHDHSDRLANNFSINETRIQIGNQSYGTWACDLMDWTSSSDN